MPERPLAGGFVASVAHALLSITSIGAMTQTPLKVAYITDQLAQTGASMRVCSIHKNQRNMQVGNKSDKVGRGPYEACRQSEWPLC